MFNHPYVLEKLIELEKRPANLLYLGELPVRPRRANGFARSVGRTIRKMGEALEGWAGPSEGPRRPSEYFPEARRY